MPSIIPTPQTGREDARFDQQVPFGRYQFVEVTFPSGANVDTDIPTNLRPSNPEDVHYVVLCADRATSLYHDQSSTRRPWPPGYVVLRSSAADATVKLLLFTENA